MKEGIIVYLRLANMNDLFELKSMYKKIVYHMNHHHLEIWDEIYPCEFLSHDIENQHLYILFEDNVIVGAFALCDSNVGEEYIDWENRQAKVLYIDRLGVNVDYLRKGIASLMITKAIEIAKNKGVEYLRLFVVDRNEPAIDLYLKNNFIQRNGVYDEVVDDHLVLHEYGFEIAIQ